jgi:hypothetical protein
MLHAYEDMVKIVSKILTIPTLDSLLHAMADDEALILLNMIATEFDEGADKYSLLEKIRLTRK